MSKKNIKNNKKKSTRKNYKIEALEPRLLMDAESQFDPDVSNLSTQLSSLYTDLENSLDSAINAHSKDVNSANLYLKDSSGNDAMKVSNLLSDIKNKIKDEVSKAFSDAVNDIKNDITTYNSSHDPDISSMPTSTYLGYVSTYLGRQGFTVGVNNSKIDISYAYQGSFELSELGFGIDFLGNVNSPVYITTEANVSFAIDLNENDNTVPLEDASDVAIESMSVKDVSLHIDDLAQDVSFMNMNVHEITISEASNDLNITETATDLKSTLNLEFNNSSTSFDVFSLYRSNDIKLTRNASGKMAVNFPDVNVKQAYSLDGLASGLNADVLPFLDKFEFEIDSQKYQLSTIDSVFGIFDQYWARLSLALNGATDIGSSVIDVSKFKSYFDELMANRKTQIGRVLNSLDVREGSGVLPLWGSSTNTMSDIALGTSTAKTSLYLDFDVVVDLTKFKEEIDFDLFKLKDFDSADFKFTLKLDVYNDGTKLCFDSPLSFEKLNVTIKKNLNNQSLHLGLFDAEITGDFGYSIDVQNGMGTTYDIRLDCSVVNLKSDAVYVYKSPAKLTPYSFVFNTVEGVWDFPDDNNVKKFLALTGETLANNTAVYLNSLRTSLRDVVEENVKLNFLNDSSGSLIEKSIANIDKIIHGGVAEKNDGTPVIVNDALFDSSTGRLVANFNSVETFRDKFNSAWNKVFGVNNVCSLRYLGNKTISGTGETYSEYYDLDAASRATFDFDHFVLDFNLMFGIEKYVELNFAESLGNRFANVSTYGAVNAKGSAGINFSLDVKFDYQTINNSTKLSDFWHKGQGESIPANEEYLESNQITKFLTGDTEINFDVYKNDGKIKLDSVTVSDNASGSSPFSFATQNSIVDFFFEDSQIVITSANEFELRAADKQQNYAELRLGGSSLQTTDLQTISISGNVEDWTSDLDLKFDSSVSIKIKKNALKELNGVIESNVADNSLRLKDLLNQYFNLQNNSAIDLHVDINGATLADGRTIMNTFGLYVVSVEETTPNSKYTIRFGCDPSRIQGYRKNYSGLVYKLQNASSTTYMRVSGALKKTGVVGDKNGILLEQYRIDSRGGLHSSNQYVDLSAVTEINSDNLYDNPDDADDAKAKLQTKLNSIYYNVFVHTLELEGVGPKYSLGVEPQNASPFIYWVDNQCLVKCRVDNGNLIEVERVDVGYDSTVIYNNSNIDDAVDDFKDLIDQSFKDCFDVKKDPISGSSDYQIIITPNYTTFYNSVFSNKFLEINVTPSGGSSHTFNIDTQNYRDLTSLANAVKDKLTSDVKDVVLQDDKLVFSVTKGTSVSCSGLTVNPLSKSDVDFIVGGIDVDFDVLMDSSGLIVSENSDLVGIVNSINDVINPVNAATSLRDPNLPQLFYVSADGTLLDHLEFRSNSSFTLSNNGLSHVLEKLGFSKEMTAVEYGTGNSDFRIVGKTLLGSDWSKNIDFADPTVGLFAKAYMVVGEDFTVQNGNADPNDPNAIIFEYVKNTTPPDPVFVVGSLVENKGNYYRIIDVILDNKDPNNIITNLKIRKIAEGAIGDFSKYLSESETSFRYMGGLSATVGFIDVDFIVTGSVGFSADFNLTDALNKNGLYGVVPPPQIDSMKLSDVTGNLSDTSNLAFSIDSYVDIGEKISKNLGTLAGVAFDNQNDGLDLNSELGKIADDAKSLFGEFKAEDLFIVLDSLVEQIASIVKRTNVKIPVINKSMSDLVDIANSFRDAVNRLRTDKVLSLQGFNDRLNKYLKDFKFIAYGAANPLVLEIVDKTDANGNVLTDPLTGEILKSLAFNINFEKKFNAVHQFSLGNTGDGINGNADLNVEGGFWLSLCGVADYSSRSFDITLKNAIDFGADINIIGEKLSFNLGLDGIDDDNLRANLISIGSNKSESYLCAKGSLRGFLGQTDASFSNWNKSDIPEYILPITVMGNLPISICNIYLGDVKVGYYDGSNLNVPTDVLTAKSDIESLVQTAVVDWLADHNAKLNGVIGFKDLSDRDFFDLVIDGDYSKSSDKFIADFSSVYSKTFDFINGDIGWFDKIKLAISGFNTLFDTLESQLNDGMMSKIKEVPVVGSALSGGVDFLGALKRKVLEPFSNFVYETSGMTAEMVAQKMNELFDGYFASALNEPTDDGGDSWGQGTGNTYYRSGADYAEWYLSLGDNYSFGTGIGFDLGFPGLGLKSDAGVNLNLNWNLDFGFGISKDKGFYFIFNDGDEVHVDANVEIDGTIIGALAGLGLEMKLNNPGSTQKAVQLQFGVDLNKTDRTSSGTLPSSIPLKGVSEYGSCSDMKPSNLSLSNIGFFYGAKVDIDAHIIVGIVSDVRSDDNPPKFPNIDGDFVFEWNTDAGEVTKLAFNDFKLDMGKFIGGVLGPIVSKIQKVIEPLEPLIDFLTTPFPVLDDLGIVMTPLSLAKQFSKGKFDDSMIYAVKDIIEISKKLSKFSNNSRLAIDIGSMTLVGGSGDSAAARNLLNGQASNTSLDASLSKYLGKIDPTGGSAIPSDLTSVSKEASSKLSSAGLSMGNSAWRFIWDKPTEIFKLLLGQDIMLVEYDMPKLSLNFDWSTFVRIYGPLGARIGVSLGASIDLGFGYDTLGIRQWIGGGYKDATRLLNGFYVNDLRNGVDIDELSFHGGLTAAAELNAGVSAGVGGGVDINVGFNFYDPNKDGKIRLNEMKSMFKEEGLFGIFDVNGEITAKLYAYIDLLLCRKEWNITGDITLFEFKHEHTAEPVMISKSGYDVVANVGSNASSRVSTNGVNKTLTDGDEILELDIKNKNEVWDKYKHHETVDAANGGKLIVNSEKGNDRIKISSNGVAIEFNVEIDGGEGNDYIDLSGLKLETGYYVLIKGGAGADTIIGAEGLNIIFGDEGVARFEKESGLIKRFVTEAGVYADRSGGDVILGGSGNDIIFGGAGDDQIDGGKGEDYIFGDGGRISFEGVVSYSDLYSFIPTGTPDITRTDISLDGGKDTLIGGEDDDVIYGGGGDDHIDGGEGEDVIFGERGHDRILGGSGDDVISGGEGMDIIFGDRVDQEIDVVAPFTTDNGKHAFSQEFIDAQFKKDISVSANVKVTENEFKISIKDSIYKTDLEDKYQNDESGNPDPNLQANNLIQLSFDSTNSYGNDEINGDDGNDLIFGDDGKDHASGTTVVGGEDIINGGIGNDIIDGDVGDDTISGGIDNDVIYGGHGNDFIDGGAGNDSLYGDQGVNSYSSVTSAGNVTNPANEKIVFGDNRGLHGELYNDVTSNNSESGDDTITTGPGMDFVDGQGGSDKVTVKFMGDDTTSYANITDSGINGSDKLFVEGTETDDRLLVRMNKDNTLGFVALLPVVEEEKTESDDETSSDKASVRKNSNIERVNVIKNGIDSDLGIDILNVNANGGNDSIFVDGTVQTTNIDGGAGADNFIIGQLYNSDRNNLSPANVQQVDAFNAPATDEEQFLSDGVTEGTKLNLEGGSGADNFVALNNVGTLNMSGGKGDDIFSVYSFRKNGPENQEHDAFERGAVLVDGGANYDTLNIRGTDADDFFVVNKEGMLSDLVAIKAAGVESTQFDAAAGDDMFFVTGNKATDMTELSGGKGNDTFSMGGLDIEGSRTLRSADTDGKKVDLEYTIVSDPNLVGVSASEIDDSKKNASQKETFTLIDTDIEPAVFIVKNNQITSQYEIVDSPDIFISGECDLTDPVTHANVEQFYIACAGLKSGEKIVVDVSAPMLSSMNFNRGDQGFVISDDGINWDTTKSVILQGSTPVVIYVKALTDDLFEEGTHKSIAISSKWTNSLGQDKLLTKSVTSVGVTFAGDTQAKAIASFSDYPFVFTEEFICGSNTEFRMPSVLKTYTNLKQSISLFVNGEKISGKTQVDRDGYVKVNGLTLKSTDKITISVRTNAFCVNDSKITLAYEDVDINSLEIDGLPAQNKDRYYELNGNVITFYNAITGQPMTVHGVVTINATLPNNSANWENYSGSFGYAKQNSPENFLEIDEHPSSLTETTMDYDSTTGSMLKPVTYDFTTVSYDIHYKDYQQIENQKKVFVKITSEQLLANSKSTVEKSRLSISCNGFSTQADGSIIVSFDNTTGTRTITVTAIPDNEFDDYGLTKVESQDKVINEIDGPVYAYGYGKSMALDTGNPAILSYRHLIENANSITKAAQFNEVNNFASEKLFGLNLTDGKIAIDFSSVTDEQKAILKDLGINWNDNLTDSAFLAQFEHKTFKWVCETLVVDEYDVDNVTPTITHIETSVAAKWFRIEKAESDGSKIFVTLNEPVEFPSGGTIKALISRNRDSIFVDEMASVDRMFVNNQDASLDADSSLNAFASNGSNEAEGRVGMYDSHALRFTHDELDDNRGITAAQMEYAEYNLGSGKDHVDVNKTLYREDAFRTFTVVNTGSPNNQNNTTAVGISVGNAKVTESGVVQGKFHYKITSNNLWNSSSYDSTEGTVYYVDAKIMKLKNGSTTEYEQVGMQRRQVDGVFSVANGFNILYDFILAEGEVLGDLEFFQAVFDDEIIVNSYREDSAGTVICTGSNVTRHVDVPEEEIVSTDSDTPVEDPDADSDAEDDGDSTDENETETTVEETVDELHVAKGFVYDYTIDENDAAGTTTFSERYESFCATYETENENKDPNAYAFSFYVDATMSDGSVQRRTVNGMTENTFGIDRDFTFAEGVSIVSVKFAYGYQGDGQLVINAQSGNDKIDASSESVTRNDMVVFGGLGDDYITMNKGGIAFGDRGQVLYDNGTVNGVSVGDTMLGSVAFVDPQNTPVQYNEYTTGIDKHHTDDDNNGPAHRLQTDGVNRDAKDIHSMDENNGGIDLINVGGTDSVVIGGANTDVIVIAGDNNVALGDNGSVKYYNADNSDAVYGDQLGLGLHTVETTSDSIGGVDNIVIAGSKNVVMGGAQGDDIRITGADNVAIGDGGIYTVTSTRLYAQSKTEMEGGQDYISTGDGKNAVIGGTDNDRIFTGAGNDAIIGDGGKVVMDTDRNALMVTNENFNIGSDLGSAGLDHIEAGDGDNVVFGGLENDDITTGNGEDVVFGDNGYATFRGNANEAMSQIYDKSSIPTIIEQSTLSFNFQGAAQTGLNSSDSVGAEGFATTNWNNISGSIAGAYGNDDREIVRFDDGTRASSISVSYAGIEWHRNTSTDNRINLQAYNLGLHGTSYDANKKFMNTGLMTTAPNNQCASRMEVAVDGLAQYYESYQVAVYLDLPDANSWAGQSVRLISLYIDGVRKQAFYVNDPEHVNFSGTYVNNGMEAVLDANGHIQGVQVLEDGEIKIKPMDNTIGSGLAPSNYVVFDVGADIASDRIVIKIEDGVKEWNLNGKDLPGIAGLQIKGTLHKQDVAASTNIEFGGNDVIHSNCGDDIIVGGTGADKIWSFDEDDRHGINDNDVVFGDNAKLLFTDRDSNENTASTLSTAESISVTADNISHCEKNDSTGNELEDAFKYHDEIYTGDGNDVVVGGIGGDSIHTNATANSERMMDNINVLSINFTREHSDASDSIAAGEAAGVVVDNGWHNFYRNDRGVIVSDTAYSQSQSNMNAYNEAMNRLCNSPDSSNPYAVSEGVEVHMYGKMNGQRQGPSSFTIENHDEIDGDTSNSKLYNTYIASQQSEEIVLKLLNLNTFVGNSGNTIDTTSYDLYVYLGGDNNDTDTYNYLYQISLNTGDGSPTQYRYLNDWTGHKFDGDYKEAYCTSYAAAWSALHDFATPRIEIIGNYVVFRNVTGNVADIRIKNVISFSGQSPKNLPMITAIQIVSGDGRYKESDNGPLVFNEKHYEYADIAIGGDHDKDLVYGDDAKLWFDLDVPFATDENIANYRNRVIEAKSVAIDQGVVTRVSTNDFIQTGKDRDVVVGGEDGDTIITGLGDDVALGGSANLMVEHNNPLGVFTPNTEIVLDQHTIDLNIHRGYLDNDNTNVNQIQYQLNQNQILGIDKSVPNGNDRYDSIDAGSGRNLTYQSSDSNAALIVTPPPAPTPGPSEGGEGQGQGTGEGQGQGSSSSTGEGQGTSSSSGSGSTEMRVETLTGSPQVLTLNAGETIKLVCTEYPQGNQWWTPNVVIYGNNAGNSTIPEIDWAWDGGIKAHTNVGNNVRIDIPDHPNGANGEYEIYLTARTSGMVILYVGQG